MPAPLIPAFADALARRLAEEFIILHSLSYDEMRVPEAEIASVIRYHLESAGIQLTNRPA